MNKDKEILLYIPTLPKKIKARDNLTIGLPGKGNHIEINGEGVREVHARIVQQDDGLILRAESADHPFLQHIGETPTPVTEILLKDGICIEIGETRIEFLETRSGKRKTKGNEALETVFKDFDQGLQPFFKEKLYRIGIIGGKYSGKTCLLTALGMPRRPDPKGLTCNQLRKLNPEAEGLHRISAEKKDKLVKEFQHGYQRIKESIQLILDGKVPQSTPWVILRMVYFLGGREGQPEANIELVDYTGEFIEEEGTFDDIPSSRKLFNILHEVDAFIVLAETPLCETRSKEPVFGMDHTKILHRIKQVFLELKKIDRPRPVGILLTKWDRYRDLSKTTFEKECEQLEALAQSPAGEVLLDLKNTIGKISKGPVSLIPVSAFGQSELVSGDDGEGRYDKPIINNNLLRAFGLEETLDRVVTDIREEYLKLTMEKVRNWEKVTQKIPSVLFTADATTKAETLLRVIKDFREDLKTYSGMEAMLPEAIEKMDGMIGTLASRVALRNTFINILSTSKKVVVIVAIATVIGLLFGAFVKNLTYVSPAKEAREAIQNFLDEQSPMRQGAGLQEPIATLRNGPPVYASIWPLPRSPISQEERSLLFSDTREEAERKFRRALAEDRLNRENVGNLRNYERILIWLPDSENNKYEEMRVYWWKLLQAEAQDLVKKTNPNQGQLDRLEHLLTTEFMPWYIEDVNLREVISQIKGNIASAEEQGKWLVSWQEFCQSIGESQFNSTEESISTLLGAENNQTAELQDRMNQELQAALLKTVNQALQSAEFDNRRNELDSLGQRFARQSQWQWLSNDMQQAISLIDRAKEDYDLYNRLRQNPTPTQARIYLVDPQALFMKSPVERWLAGDYQGQLQARVSNSGPVQDADSFTANIFVDGVRSGTIGRANLWTNIGKLEYFQDSEDLRLGFILQTVQVRWWPLSDNKTLFTSQYTSLSARDLREGERRVSHERVVVDFRIRNLTFRRPPPEWNGQYTTFSGRTE